MKKLLSKFHQYPYRFDKTVKVSKIVDADTDDDDDDGIWTAMSRLQRLRRRRDKNYVAWKFCFLAPFAPFNSKTVNKMKKCLGETFIIFFIRNPLEKTPSKSDEKLKSFKFLGVAIFVPLITQKQ